MFNFSHDPQELQAIAQSIEHKIATLQTLLKKLVDSANAQAQAVQNAQQPTQHIENPDHE
jgi:ABC-type transporter Mla subunit MlaD